MVSSQRKIAYLIALVLALGGWSGLRHTAKALTLSFPDDGLRFADLAGEVGGFAWSVPTVIVRGSLDRVKDGFRGVLEIEATGLALHDEGFQRAAENLNISGTIELIEATEAAIDVRVDLLVASGELLIDQFYLDLATYPIAIAGRIESPSKGATSGENLVIISDAKLSMAGVGDATGKGRLALDSGDLEVETTLRIHGLARLYNLLATKPADDRRYRLESTGEMTASLAYRRDSLGDFSLSGALSVRDGAVLASDPEFRLSGIEIELPVAFGTGTLATATEPGRAAFAEGTVLGGPVGAAAFAIEVGPNSIRLSAPVRVPVFGGAITLRSFDSTDLASTARRMSLAVDLANVDLEKLSLSLGVPRLSGTISASVPEIEIGSGKIRSKGELVADVFGGQIRARNLRGDSLRSTVPTFGFDLDFEAISLAELTRTLDFGYVSGIAKGSVRDLEFVSSGPVALSGWLETYPVSGVSQRISVDAIRQISIVGGGASDPFSASIMRLFDEYRYQKLGFRCVLHNDVFELDGVEVHDGDHYLVVGATIPPRVNVVSHVRRISFSDMISRIETATY